MRLLLAVLLVPILIGCRAECDGSFTASLSLSIEERRALETSAKRWETFSGRKVRIRYGEDPGKCFVRPADEIKEKAACGLYKGASDGDILIGRNCDLWGLELEAVILHEIGHSFGLEHVPQEPPSIMSPMAGALEFTLVDAAECRAAGACD